MFMQRDQPGFDTMRMQQNAAGPGVLTQHRIGSGKRRGSAGREIFEVADRGGNQPKGRRRAVF
jgi:hypothetical protein